LAEVRDVGVSHLGGITHQIADAAMKMGPGVVEVLALFDSDQVRNLGREQWTSVPARDDASGALRGYQRTVFALCDAL
jgi:hypothetical protein